MNVKEEKIFSSTNPELIEKMEELFSDCRKSKGPYDVMVEFSGGKDSGYLAYLLKNKYKLRVLAFSVIHPMVNELARANMDEMAKRLKIKHIKFVVDENIYRKFIREGSGLFSKYKADDYHSNPGCMLCGSFWKSVAYNTAVEMNIKVIINGLTRKEAFSEPVFFIGKNKRLFYSTPTRNTMRKVFLDVLGEKYRKSPYYFDPDRLSDDQLPAIIYPLSFIDQEPDYRLNFLDKNKIIDKEKIQPRLTNCRVKSFFDCLMFKYYNVPKMHFKTRDPSRYAGPFSDRKIEKELALKISGELKRLIFYIAKNKAAIDEKLLLKKAPNVAKHLDIPTVKNYLIEQTRRVHFYLNYFKMKL